MICIRCAETLREGPDPQWLWCSAPSAARDEATLDVSEPSATDDAPRTPFVPGYQLHELLGRGGAGFVYRAWSERHQTMVALKLLAQGPFGSVERQQRFQREIGALQRLNEPGVVRIFDHGVSHEGTHWLAMELVEGPTLAAVLKERAPLPGAEVARVVASVARTLQVLHDAGLVHRDIKPSNILMTERGEPKVADLGIALDTERSRMTRVDQLVGTPRYMAPEQLSDEVTDWHLVDVHALGLLLLECLGARGRRSESSAPRELVWIGRRAAAANPDERYLSAAVLADDLEAWGSGNTLTLTLWRTRMALRRHRARIGAAMAAGVLIGLAVTSQMMQPDPGRVVRTAWSAVQVELERLRREGLEDEATAMVEDFVARPAYAGTAALAHVWLDEAEVAAARELHQTALEYSARALLTSDERGARTRTVHRMLPSLVAMHRWRDIGRVLAWSDREGIVVDPQLRARMEPGVALIEKRVEDVAPAWRSLLTQRRSMSSEEMMAMSESRGLVHPDEARNCQRQGYAQSRPLVCDGVYRWFIGWHILPDAYRHAKVEGRHFFSDRHRRVGEWVDGELVPIHPDLRFHDAFVESVLGADMDGDGVQELVLARGNPYGDALTVVDLETDAIQHLRIPQVRFAKNGRDHDGEYVIVITYADAPSRQLFPEQRGQVLMHLVRSMHGELVDQVYPLLPPDSDGEVKGIPKVGDIDGDGIDDIAIEIRTHATGHGTLLFRGTPYDGPLPPVFLEGPVVLALLHLDDDSAVEVMRSPTTDLETFLISGIEGDVEHAVRPEIIEPPATLEDLLADLGFQDEAAAGYERQAQERPEQASALLSAAERSWEEDGRPHEAMRVAERRARLGSAVDATALMQAADHATRAMDPRAASLLEEALALGAPKPEWAAEAVGYGAPSWTLDLSRPIESDRTPVRVAPFPASRHDLMAGELEVSVLPHLEPALRVGLRRTSGPAWVDISMTMEEFDFAAEVELALVDPTTGATHRLGFFSRRGRGGSDTLVFEMGNCRAQQDVVEGRGTLSRQVRRGVEPDACFIVEDGSPIRMNGGPFAWDEVELQLFAFHDSPLMGRITLHHLSVGGFEPMELAPTPHPWLAWMDGGPTPPLSDGRAFRSVLRLSPTVLPRAMQSFGADVSTLAMFDVWADLLDASKHGNTVRFMESLDLPEARPDAARFQVVVGDSRLARGQLDGARSAYREAVSMARDEDWKTALDAEATLARLERSVGDHRAARAAVQRALRGHPDRDLMTRMITHHYDLAEYLDPP